MIPESVSIRFGKLVSAGRSEPKGFLNIRNGNIHSISSSPPDGNRVHDFSDFMAVPGFIDIHTHGYMGIDSMTASREDFLYWSKSITSTGVTSFIPTSVSASHEALEKFVSTVDQVMNSGELQGADILGSRLEGPFISRGRMGAHDPDSVRDPSSREISGVSEWHSRGLRIIDMAPELPGALQAIDDLTGSGIVVSTGHSDATFSQAGLAIEHGSSLFTHFYNAMSGLHHRKPGVVGAGLLSGGVVLEIIADMNHVSPESIRIAVNARGMESIALVTDSISATGLGDGDYTLGTVNVTVKDGVCCVAGTDTLAGSTLTMDTAVRNMTEKDFGFEEAIESATSVPAGVLGLNDRGALDPGKRGDVCILDTKHRVVAVFVSGRMVYLRD